MATAHVHAMKCFEQSLGFNLPGMGLPPVELVRLLNAAARLMDVSQNSLLVHHKIRHGATQTVIVKQQFTRPSFGGGGAALTWRGPALMLFARAACAVGAQAVIAAVVAAKQLLDWLRHLARCEANYFKSARKGYADLDRTSACPDRMISPTLMNVSGSMGWWWRTRSAGWRGDG
jgi:hypothetical protein